jgi:mandelate racemase
MNVWHAADASGLAWIEEPIVYDNLDGYVQLAAELKTAVQIGENFYGPRDLYTRLQRKACDYVMADFMRFGGVTGWLRAASIAGAASVPLSTHLCPEVAAPGLGGSDPRAAVRIENGQLHVPDRPGDWSEANEDTVRAHQVQM